MVKIGLIQHILSYYGYHKQEESHQRSSSYASTYDQIIGWPFMGYESSAGIKVTPLTALKLDAVFSCINVIAEDLAKIPIYLYNRTDEGKTLAINHPSYRLLRLAPNEHTTIFTFMQSLMIRAMMYGDGVALIMRDGNMQPAQLYPLENSEWNIIEDEQSRAVFYYVNGQPVPKHNIIHIKGFNWSGIQGLSSLDLGVEGIGLGLALQQFGSEFFKNGAFMSGLITHPGKMSPAGQKNLLDSFNQVHQGLGRSHKTGILVEGADWKPISVNPDAAQFIESRKQVKKDIAGRLRVPLHKIQELEDATLNNIDRIEASYHNDTLLPWATRIEQEFDMKLLTEREKRTMSHFHKFDFDSVLRGDLDKRAKWVDVLMKWGILARNEIREENDYNKLPGLDEPLPPQNMGGDPANTTKSTESEND